MHGMHTFGPELGIRFVSLLFFSFLHHFLLFYLLCADSWATILIALVSYMLIAAIEEFDVPIHSMLLLFIQVIKAMVSLTALSLLVARQLNPTGDGNYDLFLVLIVSSAIAVYLTLDYITEDQILDWVYMPKYDIGNTIYEVESLENQKISEKSMLGCCDE